MSQQTLSVAPTAPAPAALLPASIGRRVGAYAIDLAIGSGISLVLSGVVVAVMFGVGGSWTADSLASFLMLAYLGVGLVSLAWLLVYTAMQGGRGSIGQRALGLQLRDARTATPIGFGRALLRNVIWTLAGAIIVGYFSPLFDSGGRRQGWHDKVARAIVVDRKKADSTAAPVVVPPAPTANLFVPPPPGASALPPAQTFLTPQAAPVAPVQPAFSAPAAAPIASTGMISSVPGVTSPPAPQPAAAPAPAPAPVSGLVAPAQPPAPAVAPTTGEVDLDATRSVGGGAATIAVLVWDDGVRTAVYTRTLFGRNPSPETGAVVAAIRDETLSLSKTHFEIGAADGGAYVVDRHSTNGTTLVRDSGRLVLQAGSPTALRPGDRLEFGDRSVAVGGAA